MDETINFIRSSLFRRDVEAISLTEPIWIFHDKKNDKNDEKRMLSFHYISMENVARRPIKLFRYFYLFFFSFQIRQKFRNVGRS